jgi:hypothetical protein
MKRNYLYALFGLAILLGYAFTDLRGVELRQTTRSIAPAGLRGVRGGSRSFWYSGFHGGK